VPNSQYLIALGSNQRHRRYGKPAAVLNHALSRLGGENTSLLKASGIIQSRPVGPSSRIYANGAAIIESNLEPLDILFLLKQLEQEFGTRRGQRWSKRTLDLDIIFWSEGIFQNSNPSLSIPHPAAKNRDFVLIPAAQIAPFWRDPISGLTIRHLLQRLNRAKPLDPKAMPH